MLKQILLLFPLALMLMAVGCSQAVAPTELNLHLPPGIPLGAVNGEYGFNLNGKAYDSGIPNSDAGSADLNPGQSGGGASLFVGLFYDFNNGIYGDVNLSIPLTVPAPQMMPISSSGQGIHATGTLDCDSIGYIYYGALPGGIVNITKFDTINNLVSGTFEFNASETSPNVDLTKTASITTGYFNNIPIEQGGYGQGSVTAMLNGSPFTTNNNGFEYVAASHEGGGLYLWANGQGNLLYNELTIQGIPMAVGTYFMNDSIKAPNFYYWDWGNEKENVGSQSPGSFGKLIITMCDSAHRRISGSFQFSAIDSLGNTVSITNGLINNVLWEPWQ